MRSPFKIALIGLAGVSISPARAAVLDVTGYWVAKTDNTVRISVERQFNTFRIAFIRGAGASANVTVASGPDKNGNAFATDVSPPPPFPTPAPPNHGKDSISVSFSDESNASLVWKGVTYALVRDEFTNLGLAAPINPQGPETGWYKLSTQGSKRIAFVENQGDVTKILTFDGASASGPATVSVLPKARVVASSDLSSLTVKFASGAQTYVRDDFEDTKDASPFPGDGSAYSIPAATAKAIGAIDGAQSMRLRSALRERAAAYLAYLASATPSAAQTTTSRDLVAYQCVRDLTPISYQAPEAALDKIIFNTLPKANLFLQLQTQLGTSVIGEQDVSASAPNMCSLFIQGLARHFSQSTAAGANAAKTALAAQSGADAEQLRRTGEARAARQAAAAAAQISQFGSNKSCTRDEYVFLSGLGTSATHAKQEADIMKAYLEAGLGLPEGGVNVKAISNPNAAKIYAISQSLLHKYNVAAADVTQFKVRSFAALLAVKNLPAAVTLFTANEYAKAAILKDAQASANIASAIGADVRGGYRLLLTPHSQGNIFANGAIEALDQNTQSFLGLSPVASSDDHVAGKGAFGVTTSATRDDDRVLNAARRLQSGTLPATVFGAGDPSEHLFRHLFVESYLDNPKVRAKIVQEVKAALRKAQVPTTAIQLGDDAGGFTGPSGQQKSFLLGHDVPKVSISYDMFSIPDAMDVFFRGKRVATTGGPVSGTGVLDVKIPLQPGDHSAETLDVIVFGTNVGTAWNYTVRCPGATGS